MEVGTSLGFAGDNTLANNFTLTNSGGSVTFDTAAHSATLSGAVAGDDAGALAKYGTGKLILNNSANSVGSVNVNEGSLIVGGTSAHSSAALSASEVNVNNSATLGGHGTIAGNVIIHAGGILSPGNSFGESTISGNLTLSSGAYYKIEVNPHDTDEGDRTVVNGTATLAGTVLHIPAGGTADDYAAPGKKWLILSAENPFVGDFDYARSSLAYLIPELSYDDLANRTKLYLSFISKGSFGGYAVTRNEHAVEDVLDSLDQNGSLYKELLGNVTQDQARRVLNGLSGEAHASLKSNLMMLDDSFMRRLVRHVSARSTLRDTTFRAGMTGRTAILPDDARPLTGNNLWVSVNEGYNVAYGNDNAGRSSLYGTELAGGYDADFIDGWLGGLAFRFNAGRQDAYGRHSQADVMSYTAALYGGKEFLLGPGTLRFLLSGAFTRHEVESARKAVIGSRDQTLEASYGGSSFIGSFETAYRFSPTDALFLEPYASVGWRNLHLQGFTERGGNAALRNGGEDWSHALSTLGLRASMPVNDSVTFNADLGWRRLYGRMTPKSAFAFREGSDKFTVEGAALNRDAAVLGLGIGVKLTDSVKIGLNYDGEVGIRGQSHGGRAVLEVRW
jgi:outer membrane autotransporter protein